MENNIKIPFPSYLKFNDNQYYITSAVYRRILVQKRCNVRKLILVSVSFVHKVISMLDCCSKSVVTLDLHALV